MSEFYMERILGRSAYRLLCCYYRRVPLLTPNYVKVTVSAKPHRNFVRAAGLATASCNKISFSIV